MNGLWVTPTTMSVAALARCLSPQPLDAASYVSTGYSYSETALKVREDWVAEHYVPGRIAVPAREWRSHSVKRGRYWRVWGDVEKAMNGVETWNTLKPAFLANGWTVAGD